MKLLIIAPYEFNTSPPQRFRIEQWMPYLEKLGVKCTFSPFMTPALRKVLYSRGHILTKSWEMAEAFVKRIMTVRHMESYDVVYLCREASLIGPAIAERLIGWTGVPIVYDFDDAIFHRYVSPFNSYLTFLKFPGKTATLCRMASHITVGNEYLYNYAIRYNKNVTIVPTTIDTAKYRPVEKNNTQGPVVVGWTGSQSSTQYLPMLFPALKALSQRYRMKFLAIGAQKTAIPGVETEYRAWSPETEVKDISDIDIGLMPLPDKKWARGKCGLKILQYMGLGIPPVASPVGVNSEIIRDGVNGCLASTENEWVEKISRLIEDEELRKRIGMAGRRTVEEKFSASLWAGKVYEILTSVKL